MAATRSRWPLTLALCGGYFLVLLDVTIVNVALPRIGSELDAGTAGLAWTVDAYSIPLAALLLASGAIGDRIGHRRIVLLGFIGFGAASVLCAVAPTITFLVATRAVQGVGAALMLPGTLALLIDSTAEETARARLVGAWAAIGGAALPAGPVLGGLLVQAAGWRGVFWLSVPLIALALLPVLRLPIPAIRRSPERTMDWAGAALLVVVLGCGVAAIIQATTSTVSAGILALVAGGGLVLFWIVERRPTHPLLAVAPGARLPLGVACLVAGLMNLCALGGLFLLTQTFQDVHRLDPLTAGLLTLPAMVPLPLLGSPASRLTTRIGPWRTTALGLLVTACGMVGIALTLAETGTGYIALALYFAMWGTGLGILTPAIVAAALRSTPGAAGLASGASNTARQTGGALGIALFATIAGPADHAKFTPHSTGAFIGAAVLLALTVLICLGMGEANGRRLSPGSRIASDV